MPGAVVRVRIVEHPARHGFSAEDAAEVRSILRRPDGWARHGYRFTFRGRQAPAAVVRLCSAAYMDRHFGDPALRGLSVTDMSARPRQVYIHAGNWARAPAGFVGTRALYRRYLIQHEMGHCLGWDHAPVPAHPHTPCPVMMQQSRGTRGRCRAYIECGFGGGRHGGSKASGLHGERRWPKQRAKPC